MLAWPLAELAEEHLVTLVGNSVAEGKTIEYKLQPPGGSDAEKREFLKDVSSFANTDGGDIIYGVATDGGVPIGFEGIGDATVPDDLILRLENIARDGLDPRIAIEMRAVEVLNLKVLVVRVPKSWSGPHRVVFAGHGHFYGRNSAGAYQMDVGQLRDAFSASQAVVERVRSFVALRRNNIASRHTIIPLQPVGCALAFHIVPLSAFIGESRFDVASNLQTLRGFNPLGRSAYARSQINLEGHATIASLTEGRTYAYTQVWRSGIVEAVGVFNRGEGPPTIHAKTYEGLLRSGANLYLGLLNRLSISPPFLLFVAFLNSTGYSFITDLGEYGESPSEADRDTIELPEQFHFQHDSRVDATLRPIFDTMWNAFGHEACAYFDATGNYVGRRQ